MKSAKDKRLQRIQQIVEDHIADTGRLPSTPDIIKAAQQPQNQVRKDLDSLVKDGRLVIVYEAASNPTIFMPRHMYDALIREQNPPEWMSKFRLSRATRIRDKISTQQVELTELHRIEALLYAAGRSLEQAAEASMKKLEFDGLQFTYEDPDSWDLSFEQERHIYVCDVKGKSRWVDKKDVAQLTQWLQKYVDENRSVDPETVEGVLVVNHFRDLPPSERWPDQPANSPVSDAGESYLKLGRHKFLTTLDVFHTARDLVDGNTTPQVGRQQLMSKLRSDREVN
ncbi:MAG TPA: hypothetical protein VMW58_11040 [Anaerolineae bacterium]|nr:hypothetical protein [Anaerolineae bacterium]